MSHEHVTVTFKDLTYSVDLGKKQGTKVILDGISGCFKPGRLTALKRLREDEPDGCAGPPQKHGHHRG